MNRNDILRQAVQKLISLNLSEQEIVDNLKATGVSEEEIREVFLSLQNESKQTQEDEFAETEEPENQEQEQEIEHDILDERPMVSGRSFSVMREKFQNEKRPVFEQTGLIEKEQKMLDLWERGILSTVDAKIAEMQKLKQEIEKKIQLTVDEVFEKEAKKFNAVFESQRILTLEKVTQLLEKKSQDFDEIVKSKIRELSRLNSLGEEYFKTLESQKKFNESLLEAIDEKLSDLDRAKSQLFSQIDSEVGKLKLDFSSFLKVSEQQRDELNNRINKSLHLETQIVEGLLNDAQNKIDQLAISKTNELEKLVGSSLGVKSKELEELFSEKEKKLSKSFESTKSLVEKKLADLTELQSEIDVEVIKTTMNELAAFRKQFASNIEKSIASFEVAKKELSGLIEKREELLYKKIQLIDDKIKELDLFEQKFAQEMGIAIEKASDKVSEKKQMRSSNVSVKK